MKMIEQLKSIMHSERLMQNKSYRTKILEKMIYVKKRIIQADQFHKSQIEDVLLRHSNQCIILIQLR
jgi:hypothetical protein